MRYNRFILLWLSQLLLVVEQVIEGTTLLPSKPLSTAGNYYNGRVHPVANNRRKMILQCENSNVLIMKENGRLVGTKKSNIAKRFGKFDIRSHALGIVSLFNVRRRRYIAINKTGRIYSTKTKSLDIYFKATDRGNGFVTYHSLYNFQKSTNGSKHWYLAIKKDGRLKRPSRTSGSHRSTLFFPLNFELFKKHILADRKLRLEAKLRQRQRRFKG